MDLQAGHAWIEREFDCRKIRLYWLDFTPRRENMFRNCSLILCLALAVLAVGCSNAPAPPPDTRAGDVQAVKDVETA